MYKSKHKRKKNTKRVLLLSATIALMIFITVGGTIAYITDTTDSVNNTFTPSKVTTAVVEESAVDDTVTLVKIANTNNTQAYIRAAVVITWQNAAGEVYAQAPVEGTDYAIDWVGIGDNTWFQKGEYYYHKSPVDPVEADGEQHTTSSLFTFTDKGTNPPAERFYLNVEVLGSGIQSTPTSVVADEWGVTVADGGVTLGK